MKFFVTYNTDNNVGRYRISVKKHWWSRKKFAFDYNGISGVVTTDDIDKAIGNYMVKGVGIFHE